MTRPYRYQGIDRYGVARTGSVFITDLSLFVSQHYSRGWQSLCVDLNGNKMGQVFHQGGIEGWWAIRPDGGRNGMWKLALQETPMD